MERKMLILYLNFTHFLSKYLRIMLVPNFLYCLPVLVLYLFVEQNVVYPIHCIRIFNSFSQELLQIKYSKKIINQNFSLMKDYEVIQKKKHIT